MDRLQFEKSLKMADSGRNFAWINSLQEQGKLTLCSYTMSEETFNIFRTTVKAVNEVYEGDWDIEIRVFDYSSETDFKIDLKGINIYFKDLTLTNSRGASHNIKDLFVLIDFFIEDNTIRIGDLFGGRTTVSYAEWRSSYIHSHLPGALSEGGHPPYWSGFCRGSGHINQFIADINADGITTENITPFLVQILGLVSWESLEGGPHRFFGQVRANGDRGTLFTANSILANSLKNIAIAKAQDEKVTPDIDVVILEGQYKIVDNDKLTHFLTVYPNLSQRDKKRYLCVQANDDTYYKVGELPGYIEAPQIQNKYIFQGQEISVVIGEAPTTEQEAGTTPILHPILKEIIKKNLEYDIDYKKVRQSTIKRYEGTNDNATEISEPSEMVMQGDS